jgi:hypothetical protein
MILIAALAVAGCRNEPEQQASAKPPVNDLPEVQPVQGSQPQANPAPSTAMGTPTGTPTQAASSNRQPCDTSKPARLADANSDGKVTREEAQADPNLVAVFGKYDKDGDGVLSREEFQQIVDDAQQRHPDRAEFARAEAGKEPCGDETAPGKEEPQT